MITPNSLHEHLSASSDEQAIYPIQPRPRLRTHELAPVASVLAGIAGLLLIAAPSL